MRSLQVQLLGHVRNHKGLADGLPAGDTKRDVAIGIGAIGRFNERFPRHILHGVKHRLVADAAPPQIQLKHHFLGRVLRVRHFGR
jgi:hypothetical protein